MSVDPFEVLDNCEAAYYATQPGTVEQRKARVLRTFAQNQLDELLGIDLYDDTFANPESRSREHTARRNELRIAASSIKAVGRNPIPQTAMEALEGIHAGHIKAS